MPAPAAPAAPAGALSPELAALMALLSAHGPSDAREARDLERLVALLRELPAPLSRDQPLAHFTASAVVVDPTGEHTCLLLHRKLGRWLQPGGHVEPVDGGDLSRTALREVTEELGLTVHLHPSAPRPLDVDVHDIPARGDAPAHAHLDVRFLVVASAPEELRADRLETDGARWLPLVEALSLTSEPALQRLLRKARAQGPALEPES